MTELTFRPATQDDIEQIVTIIIGNPNQISTQVGMKLFGITRLSQAKRLFTAMAKSSENWRTTTLATINSEVVGLLQVSEASMQMTPRLFLTAVLLYGPFFMRKLMPRIKLQQRVQTQSPEDAYKIAELHVAPNYRGRGFGKQLLFYAEKDAQATGYSLLALQTWTSNPTIAFYERFGFTIVDTRADEEFKRLTGTAGNHLMVKEVQLGRTENDGQ